MDPESTNSNANTSSLTRGLIAAGVRNPVHANLLMVCLLAGGAFSIRGMVREAYPEFSIDTVVVEVAYPGAGTADIERSICAPIEHVVRGINGVFEVSSSAQENFGAVWLAVEVGVGDTQYVVDEVKTRVDQITTFPPEARKPVVRETILRTPVTNIAVSGEAPERTLKRFGQEVRNDLLNIAGISQIRLSGIREEEIIIEVSQEALAAHGLSLPRVMTVVAESSLDVPAGIIRTAEEEFTLRTAGRRYTAQDYEDLVLIDRGGSVTRLKDIATLKEGFEEAAVHGEFNGEPAIVVQVFKTPEEDAIEIARSVRQYVAERQAELPDRLHMSVWADVSHNIDGRVRMLLKNGLMGIALVFVTLAVFIELRLAFWVALGIPVSFAGALIIAHATGQTLNMISLFALIMVSGIIVDDAIVIAESVHTRRQMGHDPQRASIEGTCRMALPVLGSSATTIIAFIPLMYVVGVMGKLIYALPVVVIAAVIASTVEAFGILPSHLCRRGSADGDQPGPGPNRARAAMNGFLDHVITHWYRPIYRRSIRHRLVTVSSAVALFLVALGMVLGGRTPVDLLPLDDSNILRGRVRFPEGFPVAHTEEAARRLAQAAWELNDDPELVPASPGDLVRQVYVVIGEFDDLLSVRGNNLCDVRVELMPAEHRGIADEAIIERWRERIGVIYDALRVSLQRNPIGPLEHPIEIRLFGRDLDDLQAASERVQNKLREYDGLFNVADDLIPGKRELIVELYPSARRLGLTLSHLARQLRYAFYGGEALEFHRGADRITVRIRLPEQQRRTVADLENLRIAVPSGEEVPLLEVANVEWQRGYASIMHQGEQRRIRIQADVDDRRANAERIVGELEAGILDDIIADYNDVSYAIAGNRIFLQESLDSLAVGFAVAMCAICVILAWILASYVQPVVILLAVPLGLIGVIAGHALAGFDLTLMSVFGAVALSGVVVNDSLVLLDCVNGGIRNGIGTSRAVLRAGELRFRAVTLTSVTTVAALLPVLLERSSQAQAIKPMAISLGFGLLFATTLTLFVVPAAFLLLDDVQRFSRRP